MKYLAESVEGQRLRLRAKEQKGVSRTKLPARMTSCPNDSVRRAVRHYVLLWIEKLVAVAIAGGRKKSTIGSTQFPPRE